MKVVIAGGTGFIGQKLTTQLIAAGESVTLLTRGGQVPGAFKGKVVAQPWDGKSSGGWAPVLDGADVVINLCGEGIANKRWSAKQKALLRSSRLEPTQALMQAIRSAKIKPKVWINVSAVGFYGNVAENEVDEKYPQGKGFLAQLCADWEASAREAEMLGVRLVFPRIGIVLGSGKGALQKMIPPFNMFLGGPLGSGQQWFPWIHVQDVVSLILFAIKNDQVQGAFNACAPYPVRMNDFCTTLGHVLNRPSWLSVPAFALKLMLGEMAQMLLGGQKAIPKKMLKMGFKFRYSFVESALISIVSAPTFLKR